MLPAVSYVVKRTLPSASLSNLRIPGRAEVNPEPLPRTLLDTAEPPA